MKTEWTDYLDALELTHAARTSLEEVYKVSSALTPETFVTVFVSDYIDDEGKRLFENAWFFSDAYASEAKDFLSQGNSDLVVLRKNVTYIDVKWRDYQFENPSG